MTNPTVGDRIVLELADRSQVCTHCAAERRAEDGEGPRYVFLVFRGERLRLGPVSDRMAHQLTQLVAGQIVVSAAIDLVRRYAQGNDVSLHRLIAAVGCLPDHPKLEEGGI